MIFTRGSPRRCSHCMRSSASGRFAAAAKELTLMPDRNRGNGYDIFANAQQFVRNHFTAHVLARKAGEIRLVQFRLKAQHVILHECVHNPLMLRHREQHIGRRKRNVEEEPQSIANSARP